MIVSIASAYLDGLRAHPIIPIPEYPVIRPTIALSYFPITPVLFQDADRTLPWLRMGCLHPMLSAVALDGTPTMATAWTIEKVDGKVSLRRES